MFKKTLEDVEFQTIFNEEYNSRHEYLDDEEDRDHFKIIKRMSLEEINFTLEKALLAERHFLFHMNDFNPENQELFNLIIGQLHEFDPVKKGYTRVHIYDDKLDIFEIDVATFSQVNKFCSHIAEFMHTTENAYILDRYVTIKYMIMFLSKLKEEKAELKDNHGRP